MFGLLQANVWCGIYLNVLGAADAYKITRSHPTLHFLLQQVEVGWVCGRFTWPMLRMTYPETSI
jgi:hypothetical protein